MNPLQRMREAIRDEKYRLSAHANEAMSDDFMEIADVENIFLTGKIVHKFSRDPRGTRYEVLGNTTDNRQGFLVCRFLSTDILLIITTYIKNKER